MGWISHVFAAVCFLGIHIGSSHAQFVENNDDPLMFNETEQKFADVFIQSVINSHEFGTAGNMDFKVVTDALMSAIRFLKQRQYVDTTQKKALMVAFCSSIAELIVEHCDAAVALEEKTKIVTDALKNAYLATTGTPNTNLIKEVKFLVGMFLAVENDDFTDDLFPEFEEKFESESVAFPVERGGFRRLSEGRQPQFYIPVRPLRFGIKSRVGGIPYRKEGGDFDFNKRLPGRLMVTHGPHTKPRFLMDSNRRISGTFLPDTQVPLPRPHFIQAQEQVTGPQGQNIPIVPAGPGTTPGVVTGSEDEIVRIIIPQDSQHPQSLISNNGNDPVRIVPIDSNSKPSIQTGPQNQITQVNVPVTPSQPKNYPQPDVRPINPEQRPNPLQPMQFTPEPDGRPHNPEQRPNPVSPMQPKPEQQPTQSPIRPINPIQPTPAPQNTQDPDQRPQDPEQNLEIPEQRLQNLEQRLQNPEQRPQNPEQHPVILEQRPQNPDSPMHSKPETQSTQSPIRPINQMQPTPSPQNTQAPDERPLNPEQRPYPVSPMQSKPEIQPTQSPIRPINPMQPTVSPQNTQGPDIQPNNTVQQTTTSPNNNQKPETLSKSTQPPAQRPISPSLIAQSPQNTPIIIELTQSPVQPQATTKSVPGPDLRPIPILTPEPGSTPGVTNPGGKMDEIILQPAQESISSIIPGPNPNQQIMVQHGSTPGIVTNPGRDINKIVVQNDLKDSRPPNQQQPLSPSSTPAQIQQRPLNPLPSPSQTQLQGTPKTVPGPDLSPIPIVTPGPGSTPGVVTNLGGKVTEYIVPPVQGSTPSIIPGPKPNQQIIVQPGSTPSIVTNPGGDITKIFVPNNQSPQTRPLNPMPTPAPVQPQSLNPLQSEPQPTPKTVPGPELKPIPIVTPGPGSTPGVVINPGGKVTEIFLQPGQGSTPSIIPGPKPNQKILVQPVQPGSTPGIVTNPGGDITKIVIPDSQSPQPQPLNPLSTPGPMQPRPLNPQLSQPQQTPKTIPGPDLKPIPIVTSGPGSTPGVVTNPGGKVTEIILQPGQESTPIIIPGANPNQQIMVQTAQPGSTPGIVTIPSGDMTEIVVPNDLENSETSSQPQPIHASIVSQNLLNKFLTMPIRKQPRPRNLRPASAPVAPENTTPKPFSTPVLKQSEPTAKTVPGPDFRPIPIVIPGPGSTPGVITNPGGKVTEIILQPVKGSKPALIPGPMPNQQIIVQPVKPGSTPGIVTIPDGNITKIIVPNDLKDSNPSSQPQVQNVLPSNAPISSQNTPEKTLPSPVAIQPQETVKTVLGPDFMTIPIITSKPGSTPGVVTNPDGKVIEIILEPGQESIPSIISGPKPNQQILVQPVQPGSTSGIITIPGGNITKILVPNNPSSQLQPVDPFSTPDPAAVVNTPAEEFPTPAAIRPQPTEQLSSPVPENTPAKAIPTLAPKQPQSSEPLPTTAPVNTPAKPSPMQPRPSEPISTPVPVNTPAKPTVTPSPKLPQSLEPLPTTAPVNTPAKPSPTPAPMQPRPIKPLSTPVPVNTPEKPSPTPAPMQPLPSEPLPTPAPLLTPAKPSPTPVPVQPEATTESVPGPDKKPIPIVTPGPGSTPGVVTNPVGMVTEIILQPVQGSTPGTISGPNPNQEKIVQPVQQGSTPGVVTIPSGEITKIIVQNEPFPQPRPTVRPQPVHELIGPNKPSAVNDNPFTGRNDVSTPDPMSSEGAKATGVDQTGNSGDSEFPVSQNPQQSTGLELPQYEPDQYFGGLMPDVREPNAKFILTNRGPVNTPLYRNRGPADSPFLNLPEFEMLFGRILQHGDKHVPTLIRAVLKSKGSKQGTLNLREFVKNLSAVFGTMRYENTTLRYSELYLEFMMETLIATLEIIRNADSTCLAPPTSIGSLPKYINAFYNILI